MECIAVFNMLDMILLRLQKHLILKFRYILDSAALTSRIFLTLSCFILYLFRM